MAEGLNSPEEMERLLGLRDEELAAEWDAIPLYLRKELRFDTLGGQVMTSAARVRAVVGLFQQRLFHGHLQWNYSNRAVKRSRRDGADSMGRDASQRPSALYTLHPPSKACHEVFHGRLLEDGDQATFFAAKRGSSGPRLKVTVDKRALPNIEHEIVRGDIWDEQLYFAMAAQQQKRQAGQEAISHLHYA